MALFGDDDDELPQLKGVNKYYCKDHNDDFVCFSILPFWFDEKHEVPNSELIGAEKIHIYGSDREGQHVCKRVIAWRVELDCKMPKMSVLSSEGNWIRLLEPHIGYAEDFARSVLITIQMIHFVRRHPAEDERTLSNHLCEVFWRFVTKPPEVDDLQKNYPLIIYLLENDPTLMKSKILKRLVEDTWTIIESELRKAGPKQPFIVSSESSTSCDDYTEDSSSGSSDDNGDGDSDGTASDDDTDVVCALCDDGGTLLSCKGECKRSFHPKRKDGRKSFCKTLRYTPRQVKEMPTFICSNCKHKQHQCFKCGELGSSDETNPKVFQCCNTSCGHFYHPNCVAGLLEPFDADKAGQWKKHIAAGMPFTCPVHRCSKCNEMEDRTQRQLWLAVCRRCVTSYHRKCLPREISFEKKDVTTRAWEIPKEDPKIIFIYCMDHDINATIKTPHGDHIKFPDPSIEKAKDHARKKIKVTDVRNTDEVSPEPAELSAKSCREEGDQTHEVPIDNSMEHKYLKHECATNNLRMDLQYESPIVGVAAAGIISPKAIKRQEKQLGTSVLMGKTAKSSPWVVNSVTEKRLASIAGKEGYPGACADTVFQSTHHAHFPRHTNAKSLECYQSLNRDEDIPVIGIEMMISPKVGRKKKRNAKLISSVKSIDEVSTMKSLMNEFLDRSYEILSELASQLEERKQERDNLFVTRATSLEMGTTSERTEKLMTLIEEKENKTAVEDKQINKLVKCESSFELIHRKFHEVKELKVEVIDSMKIKETRSLRWKAIMVIRSALSDMTLVWAKLSQVLVGLGEEAMLDPEAHSLVQKCQFVVDQTGRVLV